MRTFAKQGMLLSHVNPLGLGCSKNERPAATTPGRVDAHAKKKSPWVKRVSYNFFPLRGGAGVWGGCHGEGGRWPDE